MKSRAKSGNLTGSLPDYETRASEQSAYKVEGGEEEHHHYSDTLGMHTDLSGEQELMPPPQGVSGAGMPGFEGMPQGGMPSDVSGYGRVSPNEMPSEKGEKSASGEMPLGGMLAESNILETEPQAGPMPSGDMQGGVASLEADEMPAGEMSDPGATVMGGTSAEGDTPRKLKLKGAWEIQINVGGIEY